MKKEMSIEKIKMDAEKAFKLGEYPCAESVIHAIRQNIAPDMPKEFISAATGFSVGVGGSKCLCGTVSAAVICLGYFLGRDFPTTPTDPQSQKTITLSYELQERFKNKNKVLCCHILNKDKEQCAGFVGDAAAICAEIIARENGWAKI